jgi:hypothetical protein
MGALLDLAMRDETISKAPISDEGTQRAVMKDPSVPFVAPLQTPSRRMSSADAAAERRVGTIAHPAAILTPMTAPEEARIRRWLARIEEHYPELIAFTIERCRDNPESREYFLRRAAEVPMIPAPAARVVPNCRVCIHRRGRHDTHWGCLARDDLPHLYGEGHPLRELPEDGGMTCAVYRTQQ